MRWILFIGLWWGLAAPGVAQDLDYGLRLGGLFGGPIATNVPPDSSEGTPAWGPSGAVWVSYPVTERLRLRAELGYAWKGASYGLTLRQDTNVVIEFLPGVQDTVPSFYVADIAGRMALHYVELPVLLQYAVGWGITADAGVNVAYLVAGQDTGRARIQIGEGGVFEDVVEPFDNYPTELNRLDVGVLAGMSYGFDLGLELQLRGYRSLRDLYRKGFFDEQGLPGNRNFHTQFYLGAGWRF